MDPVPAQYESYMNVYSDSNHHDRNVERILNMLLPVFLRSSDFSIHDLTLALLHAWNRSLNGLLDFEVVNDNAVIKHEITAVIDRNPRDFLITAQASVQLRDPYPSNPLMIVYLLGDHGCPPEATEVDCDVMNELIQHTI
jgi:hypothetical protein